MVLDIDEESPSEAEDAAERALRHQVSKLFFIPSAMLT